MGKTKISHKVTSALATAAMLVPMAAPLAMGTTAQAAGTFQDVDSTKYYANAVEWALANGVTSGINSTTFAPEQDCSRAQVVTFLWRAAGSPTPTTMTSPFTDVQDSTKFYYKAVLWALENGITTGTSATTFSPDEQVTRGQFVTFLYRAAGKPQVTATNPFEDVTSDKFYYDAVLWALNSKVTTGTSATTFAPTESCNRGQVVTFIYRAEEKKKQDASQGNNNGNQGNNGGNQSGNTSNQDPLDVSSYTILTDSSGNTIDLGGMEIIVRDWWSGSSSPSNAYEQSVQDYRDWIQETYNFTIKEVAMSNWGSTTDDYIQYVKTGGDSKNYIWVVREDGQLFSAMKDGLMYDLSTLDCLNFTRSKFTQNKLNEQYTIKNSTYAMYAGAAEPRSGVFFNKHILDDAGIDPDSIYEMQRNGTWTFSAFEQLLSQVQRDIDGDGVDDVYGLSLNEAVMTKQAVYSNGGSFVGRTANGYTYNLEDANTLQALKWVVDVYSKYDDHDPQGANWDYYKMEFISGKSAFMIDDAYVGASGGFLSACKDHIGFVMFPKGPSATSYVNCWSSNPYVIPACYDADRAWKIAFAWNLYTEQPDGYKGYVDMSSYENGKFDSTAVSETLPMMMKSENGMIAYEDMVLGNQLESEFIWNIMPGANVSNEIKNISSDWISAIIKANQ